MKLKVEYYPEDRVIHEDIDKAIENALESLGFERYASGCDIESGCRDIAFDRPNDPDL